MRYKVRKSDWKTFRNSLGEWRERYLERTNRELIDLLDEESDTPTERFWAAKERAEEEARILVDCFDNVSKSKMVMHLALMYGNGIIELSDLDRFSDDVHEKLLPWLAPEDASALRAV